MIIFGVILIIIGALAKIPILYSIGVVVLVVGLVLWVLGAMGHAVKGRRHFF
jgi:hypothetical protein